MRQLRARAVPAQHAVAAFPARHARELAQIQARQKNALRLRAEFFTGALVGPAGQLTQSTTSARQIQLSVRFTF